MHVPLLKVSATYIHITSSDNEMARVDFLASDVKETLVAQLPRKVN